MILTSAPGTFGTCSLALTTSDREIMETVEAQCFISNSIKSKVSLTAEFVVASSPK